MTDLVGVLDRANRGFPVHVELVARGIEANGLERPETVGIRAIARTLACCPEICMSDPERGAASVSSEDGSLTLTLTIGRVSVDVVIRIDGRTLAEGATWTVVESDETDAG